LGVKGVVSYDQMGTQLRRALVHLAKGGFWVPRALLFDFLASLLGDTQPDTTKGIAAQLSHREKGVYEALLENLSNKEIASRMYLSVSAVKTYVSRVLAKFGVQRRADLILLNYQREALAGKPVGRRPKDQLRASAGAAKLGLTKETRG
jgi:DNA-binding NarL/FixJ family response regulator